MHLATLRKFSMFNERRGPYQLPSALSATKKSFQGRTMRSSPLFILLRSAPAYINSKGRSIPDKHLKKDHWPYLINDLCRGAFRCSLCILISQCLSYEYVGMLLENSSFQGAADNLGGFRWLYAQIIFFWSISWWDDSVGPCLPFSRPFKKSGG